MTTEKEVKVEMHRYAKHRLRDVNQKLGTLQNATDLKRLADEIQETSDELDELVEELREVTT